MQLACPLTQNLIDCNGLKISTQPPIFYSKCCGAFFIMIVYRGSSSEDFKIKKFKPSRYGFNALFFATTIELAQLYASHRAKEEWKPKGGYVYEFEIIKPNRKINFGNKLSYNSEFRRLMYQLQRENIPSARIFNIMDYPSKELFRPTFSDVIVIFDFDHIKSFKKIQKNVRVH